MGQPELAEMTQRHILDAILDENRTPRTLEEKIVYFADKLCEDARLVDLDTRIKGLKERYLDQSAVIDSCVPALRQLQKELAQAAGLPEEKMVGMLLETIGGC